MTHEGIGSFNDYVESRGMDPASPYAVDGYSAALAENYHMIRDGGVPPSLLIDATDQGSVVTEEVQQ
jgi:hypothetical protein